LIRHIPKSSCILMPWKNGGGSTAEIARHPQAEGPFIWRVSIAEVASSGPFSRFDGYDRHILMLKGNGMKLQAGAHGTLLLDTPFTPQSFPGEWQIEGILTNGPVQDFNLMIARDAATGTLRSQKVTAGHAFACPKASTMLVHDTASGDSWLADEAITASTVGTFIIATITPR
jgi:environmental stress-induced protein Ves